MDALPPKFAIARPDLGGGDGRNRPPLVGESSSALRVLGFELGADSMTLDIEGLAGQQSRYSVYLPKEAKTAEGAVLDGYSGGMQGLRIRIPVAGLPGYKRARVSLSW